MLSSMGKIGETYKIDTGAEIIELTAPVPLVRLFHPDSLTTLEFIIRRDVMRLELTGVHVWQNPREACKDIKLRGTPVGITCDSFGPTRMDGNGLVVSSMDAVNIGCLCIAKYPDWSDQKHRTWQTKLFADAGSDHAEALRVASAAITGHASNPSLGACAADSVQRYASDVAAYRKHQS